MSARRLALGQAPILQLCTWRVSQMVVGKGNQRDTADALDFASQPAANMGFPCSLLAILRASTLPTF